MSPGDWSAVERIYAAGIATGNATFETGPPAWADFDASKLIEHRLVAEAGGRVLGWVAAVAVSDRCTYAGVVEHSVYVDPSTQGRGVGRALLDEFVASTEAAGIWTIQSGIFPENHAASPCTNTPASASSAPENGSASTTAGGATSSCSNAGAAGLAERPGRSPTTSMGRALEARLRA